MNRYKKTNCLALTSLIATLILTACGGSGSNDKTVNHVQSTDTVLPSTNPDTASFPGKRANYTITKISAGYIVTDNVGSSGSKTLSNVKNLQFSDVRVNLQIGDKVNTIAAADLTALIDFYIAFFNRIPDADGLAFWIDRFNAGMTQDQIAESFYSAALAYPAQTGYSASMSNDDFIRIIYKNVLGRAGANAPTDVEVQYWSTQLTKGIVSKGAIVKTMLVAAREFANDAKWAWVTRLLDNKQNVANFFAIQQGLNYNSTEETITKTMAIASAVTSTSTADAIALIGVNDLSFNLTQAGTPESLANICTPAAEKSWVRAHLDDVYLWYKDIIDVSPAFYSTPDDYFYALLVRSKDRFSFTSDQSGIDDYFQSGQNVGFGYSLVREGSRLRVSFVQPGSPADFAQIRRGATIAGIDNTSLATSASDAQYAALYPSKVETHQFEIRDPGATTSRMVSMTARTFTQFPVLQDTVLNVNGKKVGYMVFTDHIATAETPLINSISKFKAAGIDELVLDLRYNGGGYLYIANELAAMIGGSKVNDSVFEQLQFNDKHPDKTASNVSYFYDSSTSNMALPKLNLPRVFVLTGSNTCSASESIINGLSPFMQVILIGDNTCGKPYGFIQTNNCNTAYFAIQFSGVNALGKGDYTNGFAPKCAVADDLDHPLGDVSESRLSAALKYAQTGTCPAASFKTNPPPANSHVKPERDPYPWRRIRLIK